MLTIPFFLLSFQISYHSFSLLFAFHAASFISYHEFIALFIASICGPSQFSCTFWILLSMDSLNFYSTPRTDSRLGQVMFIFHGSATHGFSWSRHVLFISSIEHDGFQGCCFNTFTPGHIFSRFTLWSSRASMDKGVYCFVLTLSMLPGHFAQALLQEAAEFSMVPEWVWLSWSEIVDTPLGTSSQLLLSALELEFHCPSRSHWMVSQAFGEHQYPLGLALQGAARCSDGIVNTSFSTTIHFTSYRGMPSYLMDVISWAWSPFRWQHQHILSTTYVLRPYNLVLGHLWGRLLFSVCIVPWAWSSTFPPIRIYFLWSSSRSHYGIAHP